MEDVCTLLKYFFRHAVAHLQTKQARCEPTRGRRDVSLLGVGEVR